MSKLLVTGGESMIGHFIDDIYTIDHLWPCYDRCPTHFNNIYKTIKVSHSECDLLDINQVRNLFSIHKPQYVIHLATYSGNIQFNSKYPADTFYRTTLMGLNVLKTCADFKVEKVLSVISSCAIADKGDKVLTAEDLWDGLPNESIECHGFAKRNLHAFSRQLNKQYGLTAICAILNNCFGPYDSFSIEKTKVVGGMIKRFVDAKAQNLQSVKCWGSGKPTRQLVYAKDAAQLLLHTLDKYNDSKVPLVLDGGNEISIKELAETIAKAVGYAGQIEWDTSKPDGQMKKNMSGRMCQELFNGYRFPTTKFNDAIQETVNWYINNKDTWTK